MARLPTYLERHGRKLRVRVKVPVAARAVLGKTKLTHALDTDSVVEANRLKLPHVYRFKAMIEEAKRPGARRPADELEREAAEWRRTVQAERESIGRPRSTHAAPPIYHEAPLRQEEVEALDAQDLIEPPTQEELLAHRADDIETQQGTAAAVRFYRLAAGQATPLAENLEAYLAEHDHKAKTKADRRRTLGALEGWCRRHGIEPTVETITRKLAGRFVTEHLAKDRVSTTINKALSDLSSYWRWMVRRGHAVENPWLEQGFGSKKGSGTMRHKERPFTTDEVTTLLSGPADGMLLDLMRIAALSGMRLEEICSLRVRDCRDGRFNITNAKTPSGVREVPIHSDLLSLIDRRCLDGRPSDLLFPELPPPPPSRREDNKRSDPASKAFTRYRRTLGVDERIPGKRRSLVNFHSFRRWFAFQARKALEAGVAGFTPWTVADVLGHDSEQLTLGLTLGRYPGASDQDAQRACVEAIKLPPMHRPTPPRERRPALRTKVRSG